MLLRSGSLLLISALALAGCPDAHDPEPGPPLPDGGRELDGGPPRDIDSGLLRDGSIDGALEAAAADAAPGAQACGERQAISVSCGTLTCSGATPVCCKHLGRTGPGPDVFSLPPACIAIGERCEGSEDITANVVDACDDSDDCPVDWLCIDGWNKGLSHNGGARCTTRDQVTFGDGPNYPVQRCSRDCECASGQRCAGAQGFRVCRTR